MARLLLGESSKPPSAKALCQKKCQALVTDVEQMNSNQHPGPSITNFKLDLSAAHSSLWNRTAEEIFVEWFMIDQKLSDSLKPHVHVAFRSYFDTIKRADGLLKRSRQEQISRSEKARGTSARDRVRRLRIPAPSADLLTGDLPAPQVPERWSPALSCRASEL